MGFKEDKIAIHRALWDIKPVPELAHETSLEYIIASSEEVLNPIIEENAVLVVAGSYFGDEGKGKITDAIANHKSIALIVRLNSGENAGHTIYHDGKKYVFHLTPSAIAIPKKQCAIGPECVMDPVSFGDKELSQLVEAGIEYKKRFFVGNVNIVTPYHKIMDFIGNPSNSSTLKGISPSHSSKARKTCVRLDDLFNSEKKLKVKLKRDMEDYIGLLKRKGMTDEDVIQEFKNQKVDAPHHVMGFLKAKDKTQFLVDLYKEYVTDTKKSEKAKQFPKRKDVTKLVSDTLEQEKKILVESPQSYWLSNATEKHFGSATSAQTHASGVIASCPGINITKYKIIVINIAKTPADSRVGRGANPSSFVNQTYFSDQGIGSFDELGEACMDFNSIQNQFFLSVQANGILQQTTYEDKTGKYLISEAMAIASSRNFAEKGATTNKPRITGLFDCVAAAQVNKSQGPYLSISALDRGDDQNAVGMTVAYIFYNQEEKEIDSNGKKYKNGDIIKIRDQYPCDAVLEHCHPIIKVMEGWKRSPIAADKRNPDDPLPKPVQNFLGSIEDLTGFNIISIGNGQDTKDIIYLKKDGADQTHLL